MYFISNDLQRAYTCVKNGDLKGIKEISTTMQKQEFLSMSLMAGYSLITYAIQFNQYAILEWLIEMGSDVNKPSNVLFFSLNQVELRITFDQSSVLWELGNCQVACRKRQSRHRVQA